MRYGYEGYFFQILKMALEASSDAKVRSDGYYVRMLQAEEELKALRAEIFQQLCEGVKNRRRFDLLVLGAFYLLDRIEGLRTELEKLFWQGGQI